MVTENNMLRGLEKRQKGDVRKMRNTETLLSNIEGELNKWREENLKKERERVAIIQKTRYGSSLANFIYRFEGGNV